MYFTSKYILRDDIKDMFTRGQSVWRKAEAMVMIWVVFDPEFIEFVSEECGGVFFPKFHLCHLVFLVTQQFLFISPQVINGKSANFY